MEALGRSNGESNGESKAVVFNQRAVASVAAPSVWSQDKRGQKEGGPFLAQFGAEWVGTLPSSLSLTFCRFPWSGYQAREFPK